MTYVLTEQKIQVNILDSDTKQLIQKNIMQDNKAGLFGASLVSLFKDGTGYLTASNITNSEFTIHFVESQLTALGYNYNSITGNVVRASLDAETGVYMYPWVVNIYMSKL